MLAREGFYFRALLVLFDAVVIAVAFVCADLIRFASPDFIAFEHRPEFAETLTMLGFVVASMLIAFRVMRLYELHPVDRWGDEAFRLVKGFVAGFFVLTAAAYFLRQEKYSRLTLAFFFGIAGPTLTLTRLSFRRWLRTSLYARIPRRRVLIVGDGEIAEGVARAIREHAEYGLEMVASVSGADGGTLAARVRDTRAQLVIVALPFADTPRLAPLLEELSDETVDIQIVPDLVRFTSLRSGRHGVVEEFAGLPMVSLRTSPFGARERFLKRSFDVVASALGLLLVAPVVLFFALLVKLTSQGPVYFRQERTGLDGHVFEMLKFRTMPVDAECETGAIWSPKGDTRTTRLGGFLRRLSIDELPQLWNVLRGDMSLVGPRPERPVFIEQFRQQYPRYNLRHKVKAGITGWAQVNGWRGATSLEKRIEFDLYYIENWSLGLDVKILAKTLAGGFFNRAA
jgi:exopolysaccharide biosynthesis polyprenyl glycosylphosphotransferase